MKKNKPITWLHISDLHIDVNDLKTWNIEKEALLTDIESHQVAESASGPNMAGTVLKPDIIFVTGDLVWSGDNAEFKEAIKFIKELEIVTKVPLEYIFIVPGNHDINRQEISDDFFHQSAFEKLSNPNLCPEELHRNISKIWPPKDSFARKFGNYKKFLEQLGKCNKAGYNFIEKVAIDGETIEILGINSSWMSCKANEDIERRLLVGLPQVDEFIQEIDSKIRFRIALLHHPSSALHYGDAQTAYDLLTKKCDVLLHGHLHEQRIKCSMEPEREHIVVSAGAIYKDRSRWSENAYNYGVLNTSENTMAVYLRKATRGAEVIYIRDVETYPKACSLGFYKWELDILSHSQKKKSKSFSKINLDAYLTQLYNKTFSIDIRGLGIGVGKAHSFPIYDIFVGLDARFSDTSSLENDEDVLSDTVTSLENVLETTSKTIIVGDPGTGKSTFLNYIANLLCLPLLTKIPKPCQQTYKFERKFIPFLIKVSEFSEYLQSSDSNTTLKSEMPSTLSSPLWLIHFLSTYSKERNWGVRDSDITNLLEAGDCFLLFDGLDETPNHKMRQRVRSIINETASVYRECKFIVTTRPITYEAENILDGFSVASITELNDSAIHDFISKWADGLKGCGTEEAKHLRIELQDAIDSREEIKRMARNPVMLTSLCVVHWNEKRLPEQRVELYQSVIDWLLRSRENRKYRYNERDTRSLLSLLAFKMQSSPEGRVTSVTFRKASEMITSVLPGSDFQEKIAVAEDFILQEQLDSGIILARGNKVIFWHLTFMEYLAALYISSKSECDQDAILFEDTIVLNPEWEEIVLLYSGILSVQGFDKVRKFLDQLVCLCKNNTNTTFKRLGIVGKIRRNLAPIGFSYVSPELLQLTNICTEILDQQDIPLNDRISAGLAIGYIGDTRFKEDIVEKNFVRIPCCTFRRGSDHGSRRDHPSNIVKLSEYWISCYPVTNQQYMQFVNSGGYKNPQWWGGTNSPLWRWRLREKAMGPKYLNDRVWSAPNLPVVGVSWYESVAYTIWFTEHSNACAKYRLPTEAEWERAAGGPLKEMKLFPWGNSSPDPATNPLANYNEMGFSCTTPVGVFPGTCPNDKKQEKVYDLAGNIFEWCNDWFREGYASGIHENPLGPNRGKQRIVKGGSWYRSDRHLRCGYRGHAKPDERADTIGFRLVKIILNKKGQ